MESLGGEASISEVKRWLADQGLDQWKDIGTPMADLAEPASPSTQYPASQRFLLRIGNGRYRLRDDLESASGLLSAPEPPATRSRKAFIESLGATCRNWTWSWSFVNAPRRMVIFGAWDLHTSGNRSLILDEAWAITPAGKRSPAYPQSREHVRLVEEEGYTLHTFAMQHSSELVDENGIGPARIAGFTPEIAQRTLCRVGSKWFASDDQGPATLAEQVDATIAYREGEVLQVLVNAHERNGHARRACIDHYGAVCRVCGFDFERSYGPLGRGVIHVHHLTLLAGRDGEHEVDPIRDLIPVCPNCHAMIHLTREPLAIEMLRQLVEQHRSVAEAGHAD